MPPATSRRHRLRCQRVRRSLADDSAEAGLLTMLGVMPALLILTFGVLQYWFFLMASQEIEIAATEGARRAALADATFSEGADFARWFVTNAAVAGPISVTGSRGTVETTVTVTGSCRWWIDSSLFDTNCEISRTATVATERFESGVMP